MNRLNPMHAKLVFSVISVSADETQTQRAGGLTS